MNEKNEGATSGGSTLGSATPIVVRRAEKTELLVENGIESIEEIEYNNREPVLFIKFETAETERTANNTYWRIANSLSDIIRHGYDHGVPANGNYSASRTWIFRHSSDCSSGLCLFLIYQKKMEEEANE
ncbi:MAG: hypothetical protein QW429_06810 [Thermoprotei archaeon]